MAQLIREEEVEIVLESWFANLLDLLFSVVLVIILAIYHLTILIAYIIFCPLLVISLRGLEPHSREVVSLLLRIGVVVKHLVCLVLTCLGIVVVRILIDIVDRARSIGRALEQWSVTILVAVEHREQSRRVIRVVRVHRRIDRSTNCNRSVRREAEHNHRNTHNQQVQDAQALAVCQIDCGAEQCEHCKGEEYHAAIYRHRQLVHAEDIDLGSESNGVWDDNAVNEEEQCARQ